MKRHFFCRWCLPLVMLAVSLTSFSETRALILILDDDTTVAYPLADSPKILLEDGKVIVVCGDIRNEYAPNKIKGVRTGMAEISGIDSTGSDHLNIVTSDDAVTVTGARPGTNVAVYDIAGKSVFAGTITDDGAMAIDITSFVPGTYVLQVGLFGHKFIK